MHRLPPGHTPRIGKSEMTTGPNLARYNVRHKACVQWVYGEQLRNGGGK